ncbi:MAG TPA: GDSL-type esterase/lipase family protein [Pyrinomonadaceae bacterium]
MKKNISLSLLVLVLCLLPVCAQPKNKTQRSGIENPSALRNFFAALNEASAKQRLEPVRIMHFGDSHVAADVLTRELREKFQADFGDGGSGFVVPRNPMATRRRNVIAGATEGWIIEGIGGRSSADAIYGPAGINLATSEPGERAWLETSCNHFEVYFARMSGGGKIEITVDGVDALEGPITLNSRVAKLDSVSIDLPDDAPHRLQVRTLSPGRTRILGIVAEHLSGGISYDVFGINGARASRILGWNQTALATAVRMRDPNLIIIAYGTNEAADAGWTPAAYEALLGDIIQRLHTAVPKASILIYAPPDRADLPLSGRLESLVNAERRAALANNAAFWSSFAAMGGAGSMNAWVSKGLAQTDRVHLTGAGYARMAEMFYRDVKNAWKSAR